MITQAGARAWFDYDEETGVFRWKKMACRRFPVGRIAGTKRPNGYMKIGLGGEEMFSHRLAWLYVNGEWPPDQIDHINGIRDDNRIANLRLATNSQNHQNMSASTSNTSGHKGVIFSKQKNRWQARIKVNGHTRHLGFFSDRRDAAAAYLRAADELFAEFAYHGGPR